MVKIRYVCTEDKPFWYSLDRHLRSEEFANKVRDERGYVLEEDGTPVGLLRYNLFWDNTPFCTLLLWIGRIRKKATAGCLWSIGKSI